MTEQHISDNIKNELNRIKKTRFKMILTILSMLVTPILITYIGFFAFYNIPRVAYRIDGDNAEVIGFYGDLKNVNIKSDYKGVAVTKINDYAFHSRQKLNSLYWFDSILFNHQVDTSIEQLYIPESITSIGQSAFAGPNKIKSLEIPNSVITIGHGAFSGMNEILKLTIPFIGYSRQSQGSDEYLGVLFSSAIYGTINSGLYYSDVPKSLIELSITDTVSINENLCATSNISRISLPSNLEDLGTNIFSYCTQLISIEINSSNSYFLSMDGVLYDKSISKLIAYPPAKIESSFIIQNSVVEISSFAFLGSVNLTSILIPNSVTIIGGFVFYGASNLTIYVEMAQKHEQWSSFWNNDLPVIWGFNEG